MDIKIFLVIVSFLGFISYLIYMIQLKKLENSFVSSIFFKRDYFDKILETYIVQSYELIYSKHILPFIANNVTINLNEKDKFFISISKTFLQVLDLKLGTMKQKVYIPIFGSENNFTDYVLLRLTLMLQEDVVESILKRNMETENPQEQIETNT